MDCKRVNHDHLDPLAHRMETLELIHSLIYISILGLDMWCHTLLQIKARDSITTLRPKYMYFIS